MRRENRIRSSRDFARVFERGLRGSAPSVTAVLRATDRQGPPRIGVSVSKKIGGAVARNRAKRLLRVAAEKLLSGMGAGEDMVLVAKDQISGMSCQAVEDDVRLAVEGARAKS